LFLPLKHNIDIIFLMFKGLLDLIYKNKCLVCSCSKTDDLLCKTCSKDVDFMSGFPHRIYNSVSVYSAVIYNKTPKKLIRLLKFSHKKSASKVLARFLYDYFKKLDLNKDFIVIYPDSFLLKNLFRGYEHMYLIANEFCNLSGFNLLKNAIKKIKYTTPQYKAKNRKNNIKGAFEINKKYINLLKEKPILLIDDIITTGATIEEITDILKKENINDVTVLTVSKAK